MGWMNQLSGLKDLTAWAGLQDLVLFNVSFRHVLLDLQILQLFVVIF
jgi:hypothetical protein